MFLGRIKIKQVLEEQMFKSQVTPSGIKINCWSISFFDLDLVLIQIKKMKSIFDPDHFLIQTTCWSRSIFNLDTFLISKGLSFILRSRSIFDPDQSHYFFKKNQDQTSFRRANVQITRHSKWDRDQLLIYIIFWSRFSFDTDKKNEINFWSRSFFDPDHLLI